MIGSHGSGPIGFVIYLMVLCKCFQKLSKTEKNELFPSNIASEKDIKNSYLVNFAYEKGGKIKGKITKVLSYYHIKRFSHI